jgi:hypothetical protein
MNPFSHIDLRVRDLGAATEFYRKFLPATASRGGGAKANGEAVPPSELFLQNRSSALLKIQTINQTVPESRSG